MDGETYRVVADYKAVYPDPLTMETGETLQVGERDEDNDAWVWCTGSSGRGGWVPVAYLRLEGDAGVALRDYSAAELTVGAGERLVVLDEEAGWVWARDPGGRLGWVPLQNVERA